jgi:hypothetical protein
MPELDQARREALSLALSQAGLDILPEQIVIGLSNAEGLSGLEAPRLERGYLQSGSFSGGFGGGGFGGGGGGGLGGGGFGGGGFGGGGFY